MCAQAECSQPTMSLGRRANRASACRASALLEIPLVVLLSAVERDGRSYLGRDAFAIPTLLALSRGERRALLAGRVGEDRRAVLIADVQPLTVARRRVVNPPEGLEQLGVADRGRCRTTPQLPQRDRWYDDTPARSWEWRCARRYSRQTSARPRRSRGMPPRYPRSSRPRRWHALRPEDHRRQTAAPPTSLRRYSGWTCCGVSETSRPHRVELGLICDCADLRSREHRMRYRGYDRHPVSGSRSKSSRRAGAGQCRRAAST
jgi:hypothetical protein